MTEEDRPDYGFVRTKARQVCLFTLRNLRRIDRLPLVLDGSRPLEHRTAVVVGAGPSLHLNGQHLGEAQRNGCAIICTNSSDAAVRSYGVRPDIMVARESLELTDQIAATTARAVVVDVAVHPDTWDAVEARHEAGEIEGRWFLPLYPRHAYVYRRISVRPLGSGTGALTACVRLAFEMGAARVVLAGVDLSMGPDGVPYHTASPRGAERATDEGDHLHFVNREQDVERCERSGQTAVPDRVRYERVLAADWSGTRYALGTWQTQREWLQIEARRWGERVELVNATEGGSGILGWRNARLSEETAQASTDSPMLTLAAETMLSPGRTIPRYVREQLEADMAKQAACTAQIAREVLDPHGPDLRMLGHIAGIDGGLELAEGVSAAAVLDAPKDPGPKRCRAIYEARQAGATEAQKVLSA